MSGISRTSPMERIGSERCQPDLFRQSTKLNYMLRLPSSQQLVGIVEVAAARNKDNTSGLIAAADREGFVNNRTFQTLTDLVRGGVESLAYADREIQLRDEELQAKRRLQQLEEETREAIEQIESDRGISKSTRSTLVRNLLHHQELAKATAEDFQSREQTLEVMSLLGVIAGFMTHEFGSAIDDLVRAKKIIEKLSARHPELNAEAEKIDIRISNLRDFVDYSQGYIKKAGVRPEEFFPARPRIQQVKRIFGKYAEDRNIDVRIDIDPDVQAPLVPVSLYNGIALNLFTNALKAVTAKTGPGLREICFRAWNHKGTHVLEVSDSGVGLPTILRERVFDPLFTTTSDSRNPLGSGMGLGLTLVRRGVEPFGGKVAAVDAPPGYATCIRVQLPMGGPEE
jgi:signal transduction histidine kinase